MSEHPPVTIPRTERRTLESGPLDQTFRLGISLPGGYDPEGDTRYPVLYLTDGDPFFPLAVATARTLQLGGELPALIICGIGYPDDSMLDWLVRRTRDLTPTEVKDGLASMRDAVPGLPDEIPSGGAPAFLRFLREELFPFVDRSYRTDPGERAYAGDSLGGLFGLYTLFEAPQSFGRYLIGSPSIWWDDRVALEYERRHAERSKQLRARVFLSVGGLEETSNRAEVREARMVSNVREMAATLRSRDYMGLDLTTHVFEDETHLSVVPATLSRGMRVLYGG